jgi:superfamily II DNA or RNA helicase
MTTVVNTVILKITARGLSIEQDALMKVIGYDGVEKLKKKLTLTHTEMMGKKIMGTKIMRLYKLVDIATDVGSQRYILAARWSGVKKIIMAINKKAVVTYKSGLHEGESIEESRLIPGVDLNENQQVIIDHLMANVYTSNRISQGIAGCILVMGTGLGKSYLATALIESLKKKTLIILPGSGMLPDWLALFAEYYPDLKIGQYHGKIKTDGDVVIMIIKSAIKDTFNVDGKKISYSDYFKRFDFVIYDEIHEYPTVTCQEIFWRVGLRCALGITATPDERADKMDAVYISHVGPLINVETIPGYNVKDIKWTATVQVINYSGPPEYTKPIRNVNGWIQTMGMHKQCSQDPYRTQLIINKLKELRADNKSIFVFSELRDYIEELMPKITEAGLNASAPELAGVKTKSLMGGTTPESRKEATQADIILMTYPYGNKGISIVKMDAMIFITTRKSKMRQTLGRILRRGGDPSIRRTIVDIIDVKTSLKKQFSERKKIYIEKEFDMEITNISFEDIPDVHIPDVAQINSETIAE